MNRVLVIGCPGSGKSTFSKRLHALTKMPLLHLDRIFHIDNEHQITREALKEKIEAFVSTNEQFIIDGNYSGTLRYRMKFADTICFLQIDHEICMKNIIDRCKTNRIRDDIAPGFDNTIIDPEFIDFVKKFPIHHLPKIEDILKDYKGKIIRFPDYESIEDYFDSLSKKLEK